MRFIFLDLDDTILDFHRAERQALSQTLRHFHVDPTDAVLDRYHVLNRRQWELLEEGEADPAPGVVPAVPAAV